MQNRNTLVIVLSICTLVSCCLSFGVVSAAYPNVIRVPDDYSTIQEAVNVASSGDTILVSAGTYNEGFLFVNKTLTILGERASTTIVNCEFWIEADDVTLSGFNIIGESDCITLINAHGCNVSHNVLKGRFWAIELRHSNNNTVAYNNCSAEVNGNVISIYYSDNNVIQDNHVKIEGSSIVGVSLYHAENNLVEHNEIVSIEGAVSCGGVFALGSNNNTIVKNTVTNIEGRGLWIDGGGNNIYYNNMFNYGEVESTVGNVWGKNARGNYWDDYVGADLDGDGVGDTYLPWQSVDCYPLMNPWHHIPGDLNEDGTVDILDVVLIASSYGARAGDPNWNPNADLAQPWGVIDILDLVTSTSHYGQTWRDNG